VYKISKTLHMLERAELENLYIFKIAGEDKEGLKKAVQMLNEMNLEDGIDFNWGGPAIKVFKKRSFIKIERCEEKERLGFGWSQ
ncbi:hypothetical protein EW049_08595, partial [Campylobacter jejuni]